MALVVNFLFRDPKLSLYSLLLGMLLRMGIPLLFGMILHLSVSLLATNSMLYYLVAFYFVTLAAEILLTLPAVLPTELRTEKP